MLVVDSHVHIWAHDGERYPREQSQSYTGDVLASAEILIERMDLAGVDQVILIQPSLYGWDNQYLVDSAKKYSDRLVGGMVLVNPYSQQAASRLKYWIDDKGARGLRINAISGPTSISLEDPETFVLVEAAINLRIPIGMLLEPWHIFAAENIISRYPEAIFIIDHLARVKPGDNNFDQHLTALIGLSKYPNTFVKLSGFYALSNVSFPYSDLQPVVESIIQSFQANRAMWATDFPHSSVYAPYEDQVEILPFLLPSLSDLERESIMGGTARRVWAIN